MFKYLVVGGHFDKDAKPSGYVEKLFDTMKVINKNGDLINGGTFDLEILLSSLTLRDVIFWFPDGHKFRH